MAVLVWLFVLKGLIGGLLPSLARWTPFAAAVGAALTERRDVA